MATSLVGAILDSTDFDLEGHIITVQKERKALRLRENIKSEYILNNLSSKMNEVNKHRLERAMKNGSWLTLNPHAR